MNITLREVRRSWGRFLLLTGSVLLLVFLILFQSALRDGLVTAFVGAIRNQNAPVIVYSLEGQKTLQASFISAEQMSAIDAMPEAGSIARVRQSTYSVSVKGDPDAPGADDSDDEVDDIALIGTSEPDLFMPSTLSSGRLPEAAGEAVGSAADFRVGDVVTVEPSPNGRRSTIEVVGLAEDVRLMVTATLFTDIETAEVVAEAFKPGVPSGVTNVVAVHPAQGTTPEELVRSINEQVADIEALTSTQAAEQAPGVAQVRQSFQVIFILYAVVVPLVTGLFFLILTLQKAQALILLRAMGASPWFLARSLLIQATAILVVAISAAIALFYPLGNGGLGGLLRFDTRGIITWAIILFVLGLASTLASLRRILAIDPINATTGGRDL